MTPNDAPSVETEPTLADLEKQAEDDLESGFTEQSLLEDPEESGDNTLPDPEVPAQAEPEGTTTEPPTSQEPASTEPPAGKTSPAAPDPTQPKAKTVDDVVQDLHRLNVQSQESIERLQSENRRLWSKVGWQDQTIKQITKQDTQRGGVMRVEMKPEDFTELKDVYGEDFVKDLATGMNRNLARHAQPTAPPSPAPEPAAPAQLNATTDPNATTQPPAQQDPGQPIVDPRHNDANDAELDQAVHDMALIMPGYKETMRSDAFHDWLVTQGDKHYWSVRKMRNPHLLKGEIERFQQETAGQVPAPAPSPAQPPAPQPETPPNPQPSAHERFGDGVQPKGVSTRPPMPAPASEEQDFASGWNEVLVARGEKVGA